MIIVQNSNKDVIAVEPTVTKALLSLGIRTNKADYLRRKLSKALRQSPVDYKSYLFIRW